MDNKIDYGLSFALVLLGVGILSIFFPFDILDGQSWGKYQIDIGNYSELGEFISGVTAPFLSAAAFILLYQTYKSQKIELAENRVILKDQSDTLSKQQFETTFFNLLTVYNNTVEQLEIKITTRTFSHGDIDKKVDVYEGKDCLSFVYEKFREHYTDTARGLVDKTDKEQIDSIYNDIYLNYETKLGHYFRVLYHIVLFVDSSDIENKKDYTNLLRAQLSSRETLLLCFNCISRFGYDKFLPLVEQYSLLKHINDNKELLRYKFDNIIEDKAFNLDE